MKDYVEGKKGGETFVISSIYKEYWGDIDEKFI